MDAQDRPIQVSRTVRATERQAQRPATWKSGGITLRDDMGISRRHLSSNVGLDVEKEWRAAGGYLVPPPTRRPFLRWLFGPAGSRQARRRDADLAARGLDPPDVVKQHLRAQRATAGWMYRCLAGLIGAAATVAVLDYGFHTRPTPASVAGFVGPWMLFAFFCLARGAMALHRVNRLDAPARIATMEFVRAKGTERANPLALLEAQPPPSVPQA